MKETTITVTAVPMGEMTALHCSACGVLDMAGVGDVAPYVRDHMNAHGCDLDRLIVKTGD